MLDILAFVATLVALILFLRWYSYSHLKKTITARRRRDRNICCGTIDGGGINADIVRHGDVRNFVRIDNIYRLPFPDKQFGTVLCSHTAEHVEYPRRFDRELKRVGRNVVYILPPLRDLAASLNFREHRWVFLTLRKVHEDLPRCVELPFARRFQARVGQKTAA